MRSLFQFSLKFGLFLLTISSVFMATVRVTDLSTALLYFVFFTWLLSPILVTFVLLYIRTHTPPPPRRRAEADGRIKSAGVDRESDT